MTRSPPQQSLRHYATSPRQILLLLEAGKRRTGRAALVMRMSALCGAFWSFLRKRMCYSQRWSHIVLRIQVSASLAYSSDAAQASLHRGMMESRPPVSVSEIEKRRDVGALVQEFPQRLDVARPRCRNQSIAR